MMRVIWGSILTAIAAAGLTFVVRAIAHRLGMVSYPRLDRWHRKPTAMLGGMAIYAAFAIGFVLFGPRLPALYPILGAGTLLFFAGLLDDVVQIKPYTKLIIQLAAAAIVVYFGIRLPWTRSEAVNDFITIFWLPFNIHRFPSSNPNKPKLSSTKTRSRLCPAYCRKIIAHSS